VSLARRVIDALNPLLTSERTVEAELASGMVIEEEMFNSAIRVGGRELTAEMLIADPEDMMIETGLLSDEVFLMNFLTCEAIAKDHAANGSTSAIQA
jgi:hypothetical protein